MKRLFDIIGSLVLAFLLIIPFLLIAILVKITSKGPVLHWSVRVGRFKKEFLMPKVRTMLLGTPQLATHLLGNSNSMLTPVGGFLRKMSLDEIPQLYSILKGDMSFVGPRPALFNQDDLIELREKYNINSLKPGLTGWAQINGRDELTIPDKVKYDLVYLQRMSIVFDLLIILKTTMKVLRRDGVKH